MALGTGNTIGLMVRPAARLGLPSMPRRRPPAATRWACWPGSTVRAAFGALILNNATSPITGALISARTNSGVQFTVGGTGNINTLGSYTGAGTITGTRLISTVATGTAPLQVASTTLVPNLNASLLGGNAASAFALASGSPGYIWNGTALQSGANFNISGNGSANSFNSATTYGIGGSSVLTIGNSADFNLFLGVGAGASNVAGQGLGNVFSGYQAGFSNTTGATNIFSGYQAGFSNTTGFDNTFVGSQAGQNNTTGSENHFFGLRAGASNTTGASNAFFGDFAGSENTTGSFNSFYGTEAGAFSFTGSNNSVFGANAGSQLSGSNNTLVGAMAFAGVSGSGNTVIGAGAGRSAGSVDNVVYIGSPGVGNDGYAIRIGFPFTTNSSVCFPLQPPCGQSYTFIAGISGADTNSGVPVFIDSTGKLGTFGGSGVVTSFNGRTGVVHPAVNDYNFSMLFGVLGNSQLSGTYTNALTLNNQSNSFAGNGAGLTGVPPAVGSANYIQNGTAQQASANFNVSGTGSANVFNSATTYQIGGSDVLGIGNVSDKNLFLGVGAGVSNTAGAGTNNVFSGYHAGHNNTTGYNNAFYGLYAGEMNSTGHDNVFVGPGVGVFNTTGFDNTFIGGENTGYLNAGSFNTFIGSAAGSRNTTGAGNLFVGISAGQGNTTGTTNVFYGWHAGDNNTTGSYNVFTGIDAGTNVTTGSSNIYLGNLGCNAPCTENNTIRIGTQGTGNFQQNTTYIAGIWGSVASGGTQVFVNGAGQLGTNSSSRRFKEQIRDMGDSTNALMKLRPVTFLYKPEYDKGRADLAVWPDRGRSGRGLSRTRGLRIRRQALHGEVSVPDDHAAERDAEAVSPGRGAGRGDQGATAGD